MVGYGAAGTAGGDPGEVPVIRAHTDSPNCPTRRLAALVAAVAAVAAVAMAPAAAHEPGTPRYRVRPGDTLSEVAARLGTSTGALAAANGLEDHDHVVVGQWLVVPPRGAAPGGPPSSPPPSAPAAHRVVEGETLSELAARYGTSVAELAAANGLDDPHLVVTGTLLRIPSGAAEGSGSTDGRGLPGRLLRSPDRLALRPVFVAAAAEMDVPADLLQAMTYLESGWQAGVVSPMGAVGVGQLMPATVDHMEALMGEELDPADPVDNIRMSARYLRLLLDRWGSPSAALAAYYQGTASVERRGVLEETATYVRDVLALLDRF